MSRKPPIPEANQSPYPIQEPPHDHADTAREMRSEASDSRLTELLGELPHLGGRKIIAVGGALALGVAATIGALLFARRSTGRRAKPA